VNSVISRWDLDDMHDGMFLKRFRVIKPDIPTIALVRAGDREQEIAARSLGVSAVLTDDASDELFRDTVANVLKLEGTISIRAITNADNEGLRRER
jgi:DNA-binding NarL/FixJ family response regulator